MNKLDIDGINLSSPYTVAEIRGSLHFGQTMTFFSTCAARTEDNRHSDPDFSYDGLIGPSNRNIISFVPQKSRAMAKVRKNMLQS